MMKSQFRAFKYAILIVTFVAIKPLIKFSDNLIDIHVKS